MKHRILWLIRAYFLKNKNIFCHWLSYVDKESVLGGHNYLAQRSKVIKSKLGLFSYINFDSVISNSEVGRFCCIGPESWVGGIGSHPTDWKSTHRMFYSSNNSAWKGFAYKNDFTEVKKTIVGNDVWIGARCTILDGVTIGDGAIIATGSIVVKDVAPYSIVGGVPAKQIKKRFDDETISALLAEKWWDIPINEIKRLSQNGDFYNKYTVK